MRVDIKRILKDPSQRKELIINASLFLQHLEGIDTTKEQMEEAYYKIINKSIT